MIRPAAHIFYRYKSLVMRTTDEFDVCVIGAGVAGGVLAAYLGKNGLKVAVIEKNLAEQERMIGELLQPGGVIKLRELGLENLLNDLDARPIEGYGLFMNGECFRIAYPDENGKTMTGRGLRNGKFVQRIRTHISKLPSVQLIEGNVNELLEDNGRVVGVKYAAKGEEDLSVIRSTLTVVCDGMFSGFRDQLSAGEKKVSSYFLGMILKNCELPFKDHGHVILSRPSPCLVYPICSSETRILIDFPGNSSPRKGEELTTYLINNIGPQLPPSILPSFIDAVGEGKFKTMPNHLIPAKPFTKAGVVMIGDSLNMRHPLTGGGMTAAFSDIQNLGERLVALVDFESTNKLDAAVSAFYDNRHKQNATINILADALYGVMQNEDLRIACYEYLRGGGKRAREPISILSAISRDKQLLMKHFFAVAFFGMGGLLKPYPNKARVTRSYTMLKQAVKIVSPLVMNENPGLFTRSAFKVARAILLKPEV